MSPAQREERNTSQLTPVVGERSHATHDAVAFEDEARPASIRQRAAVSILPNGPLRAIPGVEHDRRRYRRLARNAHCQGLRLVSRCCATFHVRERKLRTRVSGDRTGLTYVSVQKPDRASERG
jgi:hypothetical protein